MSPGDKAIDLYGFGIAAVDELIEVDGHPAPGAKVPAYGRRLQGGGLCTTALVAAARLGLRCRYDGMLGQNELSDFVRAGLTCEGIEYGDGGSHPEAEPYYSVIVVERRTGERTILSSGEGVVPPSPCDIREECIRASRALFLDHLGSEAGRFACDIAHRHGIPVIADIERIDDPIAVLLESIDHLILPLRLALEHSGATNPEEAVRGLGRVSRACTAVTDGARGCWYLVAGDDEVRHQIAFPVEVVDTTGCGDVFHGAYAAGIVWGWPVGQALRFASAAAALKALKPGAQLGAPGRADVEAFLNSMERA